MGTTSEYDGTHSCEDTNQLTSSEAERMCGWVWPNQWALKRPEIESQERCALTNLEKAANYHLINCPGGTSQGTTGHSTSRAENCPLPIANKKTWVCVLQLQGKESCQQLVSREWDRSHTRYLSLAWWDPEHRIQLYCAWTSNLQICEAVSDVVLSCWVCLWLFVI